MKWFHLDFTSINTEEKNHGFFFFFLIGKEFNRCDQMHEVITTLHASTVSLYVYASTGILFWTIPCHCGVAKSSKIYCNMVQWSRNAHSHNVLWYAILLAFSRLQRADAKLRARESATNTTTACDLFYLFFFLFLHQFLFLQLSQSPGFSCYFSVRPTMKAAPHQQRNSHGDAWLQANGNA